MQLSLIIPCFNESPEILKKTVDQARTVLSSIPDLEYEILVVNDGSTQQYDPSTLQATWISHEENCGYGAALTTGIRASRFEWIGITDSDGTYPLDRFPDLIRLAPSADVVIGRRSWNEIPWVRRPAKLLLHFFACFMAGGNVIDLNSGMRVFRKSLYLKYENLFPKRFSFTSTMTMIALTRGYRLKSSEISYSKRVGFSSIKPIRDTVTFFSLVTRLSLYFNPLRIFVPMSGLWFCLAVARGIRDYSIEGHLGNLCLILFFMGFQTFFFGLLAEIINKRAG